MNMEHFIAIVFWIATLSGCLQANPLPSDSKISNMQTNVTCPPDSVFYAPTDVTDECITTALDCVKRELEGTATNECYDPNDYIGQEVDYLEQIIRLKAKHTLKSSECPCEIWPETSFSEFLKKTNTLLQLSNSVS